MQFKTFPEFGKELKRPFEVHENCYDCADFYDDCKGWRASRGFACGDFNRLPNVVPGTYGQRFPASRRSELAKHQAAERDIAPGKSYRESSSTAGGDAHAEVAGLSHEIHKTKVRACGCGAALPKGKRLCELCRTQRRRQTKRGYMRSYMEQRRSAAVDAGSGMPPAPIQRPATGPRIENVNTFPSRGRGEQTSVLTKRN